MGFSGLGYDPRPNSAGHWTAHEAGKFLYKMSEHELLKTVLRSVSVTSHTHNVGRKYAATPLHN